MRPENHDFVENLIIFQNLYEKNQNHNKIDAKRIEFYHFGEKFAFRHFSNFVIKNSKNHVFKNAPKVIEIVSKKLNFHQKTSKSFKIIPAHQLQLRFV